MVGRRRRRLRRARGGEEGRPPPSAWVTGRGVRLEAALGPPMATPPAGRLGRAIRQLTSAPGPWLAPANQTPSFAYPAPPLRPSQGPAP